MEFRSKTSGDFVISSIGFRVRSCSDIWQALHVLYTLYSSSDVPLLHSTYLVLGLVNKHVNIIPSLYKVDTSRPPITFRRTISKHCGALW